MTELPDLRRRADQLGECQESEKLLETNQHVDL